MRNVIIFFLLVYLGLIDFGRAQEPTGTEDKPVIESVDVSGVPDSKITAPLHDAMQALVGERFDQLKADELGFRIQSQVGQRISAIRQLPGSAADRVKLLFEFSNAAAPEPDREPGRGIHIVWDTNVNSRYTVESVELRGFDESALSDSLREAMHKLVGEKMDDDRANAIERRLRRELTPEYIVSRRVARGSDRDHVRLVYEATKAPLLNFHKFGNYLVGQSKQGVSYGVGLDFGGRNNRFAVGVLDDGDALIERDEGYRLGFQNIHAGTDHLGFRFEYFDYNVKWKSETQLALAGSPEIPGIYRERRGIVPRISFAPDSWFTVDVGVNVTELQMQYPQLHFQNANALSAELTFQHEWENDAGTNQRISAKYGVNTASHNLDSDFIYTRHLGQGQYTVASGRNRFLATGMAGVITGQAPLFERFDLGNTTTLRGWNKYDLDPIGGNRMAYGSLEYRYSVLQIYYDVGSVWQHPSPYQTSHAVGVGLHSRNEEKNHSWFVTFGVPINSGHIQPLKPLFIAGVRF